MSDNGKKDFSERPRPHDYRCRHCARLLFRCWLEPGSFVEIRCPRCGRLSVVEPGNNVAVLIAASDHDIITIEEMV